MIENFILQTDNLSWIAILIAGISAGGVIGSLLLNWYVATKENDRKYAEFISKYIRELDELQNIRHTFDGKPKKEIMTHITTELNIIEEIVFLNSKGKIPFDMTIYFKQWIEEAFTTLEAIDGQSFEDYVIHKENWHHLLDWCKEHNIEKTEYTPALLVSLMGLDNKSKSTDSQHE